MSHLRQKDVDYSICQALSYSSTGIDKALIIYDVACQWYVKFAQRVEACPALQTPEDLEIVPAVGSFHLSAHKLECFPRFSLMFIQGAGHINGEILQTVKSGSTPVGGPVKSGQKRTRAGGQRFGQRLARARVATNWIQ